MSLQKKGPAEGRGFSFLSSSPRELKALRRRLQLGLIVPADVRIGLTETRRLCQTVSMDFELPDLFSADLHLGHPFVATETRGFDSVEDHNEALIERWNSVVGSMDTVGLLGDACMGVITENLPLVRRLNGRIWLMPGNHDWPHPGHHSRRKALAKGKHEKVAAMEKLYADIFDRILPLTIEMDDLTICHLPPTGDHGDEDRYPEYRPVDRGQRVLHGHIHEMWQSLHDGRWINVGVDVWDLAPVSYEHLRREFGF